MGALDDASRSILQRLYRADFERFGYATQVPPSRAAFQRAGTALSLASGVREPTRVFGDDPVGPWG